MIPRLPGPHAQDPLGNRTPNFRGNQSISRADSYPATRLPLADLEVEARPLFADRYRIVAELGRGGMGVVYRARDTRLPRDVAIKAPLHLRDPESLRRFFQEAEAAAKLDHPQICRILDVGEVDGLPFIVLAFIEGRNLADVAGGRPVDPTRACKVVRNLARTIQFAHDRGIIHRDLKPANLMVGPRRELIVMDFGLARCEGDERKTVTGQIFGTPPYMSPEQVLGRSRDMGKGCDIYALGVIFYELLTGRLPFRGPIWDLSRQIIKVEPIPPSTLDPTIDRGIDAIVLKALAKSFDDRFRSMDEFARSIADHLRGVGSLSNSDLRLKISPTSDRPGSVGRTARNPIDLPVHCRPEPLRESRKQAGFKNADAIIWGGLIMLILIVAHLFVLLEDRTTSLPSSNAQMATNPIVKPSGRSPSGPSRAR